MRAQLRRRLEMAERVRDFLRAHQTDGVGQGLGLAKLGRLPVQVTVVTPTSFTFTALYGHFDAPGSTITFLMRTDAAGLFHFEQLGIGRSSESSISDYLYAPSVAAFAWTMQAENVRQWVFSTLSFTQVAP